MAGSILPLQVVSVSALGYYTLSQIVLRGGNPNAHQGKLDAISSGHAVTTTAAVIYALLKSDLPSPVTSPDKSRTPKLAGNGNLDDSANPLIQNRSNFANLLTAWETGYMLYDTWAMVYSVRPEASTFRGFGRATLEIARKEPVIFGHHIAVSTAFLYLQYYIYEGRERGIWIIVAFLLMSASNPLLYLRWWVRRQGKRSIILDFTFATVFAISRFGSVVWTLSRYGAYHGLKPIEAYRRLRISCQLGTGSLVGLNAIWWAMLMGGIFRRTLRGRSK